MLPTQVPLIENRNRHLMFETVSSQETQVAQKESEEVIVQAKNLTIQAATNITNDPLRGVIIKQVNVTKEVKSETPSLETANEATNGGSPIHQVLKRKLGSQELLMLPRQYRPKETGTKFPQMTHVTTVTLSATPNLKTLEQALSNVMEVHPLLRCHVEGSGQPTRRIDLFQMVRSGNPDPETFVVPPSVADCEFGPKDLIKVVDVKISEKQTIEASWKQAFEYNLDNASFDTLKGPMWSLELHRIAGTGNSSANKPCALLFTFNHAISDQSSANLLIDHLLMELTNVETKKKPFTTARLDIPKSMEECTLGAGKTFEELGPSSELLSFETAKYVLGKAAEGFKNAPILPDQAKSEAGSGVSAAFETITGRAPGGASALASERVSVVEHRTLSKDTMSRLLEKCRENEVTMSNLLTSIMAFTASDFIDGTSNELEKPVSNVTASTNTTKATASIVANSTAATATAATVTPAVQKSKKKRNYKVLQSLDFRRFGVSPDPCETVGCQAGSMDLMLGPIEDGSGKNILEGTESLQEVWKLAKDSKDQTKTFCVETNGPQNAVRVFDFAMTISDMNNLVDLTAKSASSQGRAYSAGVTNAGVFEKQQAVPRKSNDSQRSNLKTQHGRYRIEELYYATSHARSGSLYQLSLLTINGEGKLTFHPVSPIVSRETSRQFADNFVSLAKRIASESVDPVGQASKFLSNNGLVMATSIAGIWSVTQYSDAWSQFYVSVLEMYNNVNDPADFWAALNFWIFFAVGHPILQPILFLSDVLHGSPGPRVGDLVPLTFIVANVLFIGATLISKQLRTALNIAALSAFLTYVGAGLDGDAGLGDYNLALDDSYKGKIVKGCPAYEDVALPSMKDFDLTKYQGKWYEHKFHDWTQFKEVYDTTLDIKLTEDGQGWVDDFAVKGPAPLAAKLSWDKSPVANGAHYFLFGRVDPKDPPGVLRESGFGVEFPNYIVDVQKDPKTGEYTEAIQFQCLERGGVRVFEGINFMSRSPKMTEEQLTAMHARAKQAGMYPYGASPQQMHRVERRPEYAPPLDNAWQTMWNAIGVDKLLELLTESIEDGGRQ